MNRLSKAVWLVALAIGGCAAPGGSHWAHRTHPQGPLDQPGPTPAASRAAGYSDEMQFQLAEARWRRNESQACEQTLEEIVARNPAHRGASLRLAEVYLLRNQPYRALGLMQGFCRKHRDDAEAHHLLGLAYESVGRDEQALGAYDVAATLDPEDPIVLRSLQNAVAAREGPDRPAQQESSLARAVEEDEERSLAAADPHASSSDGLPDDDEPNRLDGQSLAERRHGGPRIAVVPIKISRTDSNDGKEADDESTADELSDTAGNDLPHLADQQTPEAAGQSPVRWAYELEVGHVRQSSPEKEEEPQARSSDDDEAGEAAEAADGEEQSSGGGE